MIHAEAFGKFVIAGEYSVLLKNPAIAAAVNITAKASFIENSNLSFSCQTGKNQEQDDYAPLFRATIDAFKAFNLKTKNGAYFLDTSNFFKPNGQKLGLGSSAAGICALIKVIFKSLGIENKFSLLFSIASKANQNFSGQIGSNIDIAASLCGGTIFFNPSRPDNVYSYLDFSKIAENLLLINLNQAQDTRVFASRFLSAPKTLYKNFAFEEKCNDVVAKLSHAELSLDSVIFYFSELNSLFNQLGQVLEINICTKEHQKIARLAERYQGAAKPSGAGGGDISLAIVPKERRAAFIKELELLGYKIIPYELAPRAFA